VYIPHESMAIRSLRVHVHPFATLKGLRAFVVALLACALAASAAARQSAPRLTTTQRDTLQAIVAEVDRGSAALERADAGWQIHVLRTSDGAHYVAFSIAPPADRHPPAKATIYVRLASRQDPHAAAFTERSAVMEWLKGMRSDPLVAKKRRGIAFGEMPIFGAAGIATRGPGQQTSDLALLNMERDRARERKEAAERDRKAALERASNTRSRDAVFPFEDFAVDAAFGDDASHPGRVQRSVTAGPGDYDLYVAWAGPPVKGKAAPVHVVKRSLRLPPASTTEFVLSSVILADAVGIRETPYPPDRQSSHPYAIGPMEIVPAADDTFTNTERLAVVFQAVNAQPNDAGKPDVSIGFQLFRRMPDGERSIGLLNPQHYNAATLPADFDLRKGHPVFAAMAAPLKSLARGDYRLMIEATDKHAGRTATAQTTFRIVATPATLLATAPVSTPLRRESLLEPAVLREAAARLIATPMSPPLAAALDAAREGRFVDLLREDASEASERSVRTTLRGIGLYGLGDPRMASTILRQSIQGDPNPVAQLYLGAARALEANDRDAVAAWQAALDGGLPPAIVAPLLVDAHLRLGDLTRAHEVARTLVVNGVPDPSILRGLAAIHIAQGREAEAIPLVERHLAAHPDDADAQYVMLHALFAGFVNSRGVGATTEGQERFRTLARAYVDAKARHAAVVGEWMEMVRQ
jgi:tetratricopeptide (TPR) repeat protein